MVGIGRVLLYFSVCFLAGHSFGSPAPVNRWLNVFFREIDRNVPMEVLEDSVIGNEEMLVLIEYPHSVRASYPLGVRISSRDVCKEGKEAIAFATDISPSKSYSITCMEIHGHMARLSGKQGITSKDLYKKSLSKLLKLYPDIQIKLPYTQEEIHTFVENLGTDPKNVIALENKMAEIQRRENFLSRTIHSMNVLYDRASNILREKEEEEEGEDSSLPSDEADLDDDFDEPFEDPFFTEEVTYSSPDMVLIEEEGELSEDETPGARSNDQERQPQSTLSESTNTAVFENNTSSEDESKNHETEIIVAIILTILLVSCLLIIMFIVRRKKHSRILQISDESSPSSVASTNDHNIFEPQILDTPKDAYQDCCTPSEIENASRSASLLAVKISSPRDSVVSSTPSNAFEVEAQDGLCPNLRPISPVSLRSTHSCSPRIG